MTWGTDGGGVLIERMWFTGCQCAALESELNPSGNIWLCKPGFVFFQLPWGGQQAVHNHNYSALCAEAAAQALVAQEQRDYRKLWSMLDVDAAF